MQEYVDRLISCGYSADNAQRTCRSFLKDFSIEDLKDYVKSVETDAFEACHVAAI